MKGYVMLIKKLCTLLIVSIAILSICAGCQTLQKAPTASQPVTKPVTTEPAAPEASEPAPQQSVVGTARYYASRFHGRKTASGEIYNQKKMTAAHESLPFGTLVKVENLANSLSVIVKVNDRCRKHEKVFIDVSREAALELGFIRQGTAKVRLTVLNTPEKKNAATAKD
jgi:rare lipoprotein A